MSDFTEQNSKSLERIAEALESISLFLQVLMGEDQTQGPTSFIETQDGVVEIG